MKRLLLVLSVSLVASIAAAQDLQPPPPMTEGGQQPQPQPQPQPQAQPQPQPTTTTLAPPPPMQQQAAPAQPTEQKLDQAKKEDSGRGLEFFYMNAQGGGVFDALGTFTNTLSIKENNAGGAFIGAEAGVRFVWFTLGMRFRYEFLQSFNIWQLDAVAGFHIPAGKWDPYVSIHGGYAAIGSLDPKSFDVSQVAPCSGSGCSAQDAANQFSTRGGNVGFAIGADYYFVPALSFGVDVAFELLFLHRDPLAIPDACKADPTCSAAVTSNDLYQKSGDAAGVGLLASAHLALHL